MANTRSYRELRVNQDAIDGAMQIFVVTKAFPKFALRCAYLDARTAQALDRQYDGVLAQLVHMITHAEHWTLR